MRRIVVSIETDHDDTTKALKAVSNALTRAGYDVGDSHVMSNDDDMRIMGEVLIDTHGIMGATEPDLRKDDTHD